MEHVPSVIITSLGASTQTVTLPTFDLSTWRPPWGPMSFAPMAASSRIDRGTVICQNFHFQNLILAVFQVDIQMDVPYSSLELIFSKKYLNEYDRRDCYKVNVAPLKMKNETALRMPALTMTEDTQPWLMLSM